MPKRYVISLKSLKKPLWRYVSYAELKVHTYTPYNLNMVWNLQRTWTSLEKKVEERWTNFQWKIQMIPDEGPTKLKLKIVDRELEYDISHVTWDLLKARLNLEMDKQEGRRDLLGQNDVPEDE